MTTIMTASRQWASRPADERFCSLDELVAHTAHQKSISRGIGISTRHIEARPLDEGEGQVSRSLVVVGPADAPTVPTHWSFGQLAERAGAPAGYLRTLPADMAADCINYGLARRDVDDLGCLLRANGGPAELAAVTGPQYGRVWNADVARTLRERFGDGVTGDFTVPGEFGVALDKVTKANTTLFASDRDMFVFLADEKHRITVPNRRDGRSGEMARGIFVWNSEVGAGTLGMASFLFDYVCCNRIVWGAEGYQEVRIRHTKSAPDRWLEDAMPAIQAYADKSTHSITQAIDNARDKRLGDQDAVLDFLAKRFTRSKAAPIMAAHMAEHRALPPWGGWVDSDGGPVGGPGHVIRDDRIPF